MKISWQSMVVRSPDSIPPVPGGWPLNYVLAFDRSRKTLVYIREPDHHQFGETWHLDSKGAWIKDHEAIDASSDQFWTGHYDPIRKGVMCWTLERARGGSYQVVGLLVDAHGVTEVTTQGELPIDEDAMDGDSKMIFAFDPVASRNLAITPYAIWYLDQEDTWQKLADLGDEFPREWHENEAARAVWDYAGNRLIIGVVDSEEYEGHLFAFDGNQITALGTKGLPEDVDLYSNNSTFVLASSEEDGVLLVLGEPWGTFRLEGNTWSRITVKGPEARRANAVRAAVDERDGSLWLGPGPYELTPGSYAKNQEFFYRRTRDGEWRLFGHLVQPSPTEWYGDVSLAGKDGRLWIASRRYPLGLRVADKDGWQELVSEVQATQLQKKFEHPQDGYIVSLARDGSGILHAFAQNGAVFQFVSEWSRVTPADEETFGDREDFLVHWDSAQSRFVAWGGRVKNRESNHTFYLGESGWTKEKKTSAKPSDTRHKHIYIRPKLAFDPHLGSLVRFGFDDISVFRDGVWEPHIPANWEESRFIDAPFPVADSTTGEILLVDLYAHTIFRFNYDKVEKLADIIDHEFAIDPMERGTYAHVPLFVRRNLYTYDPDSQSMIGQGGDDEAARFQLPLAEVFEAAAALGKRANFESAPVVAEEKSAAPTELTTVRLYCVEDSNKFWFGDVSGASMLTRWGSIYDWGVRLERGTASSKTDHKTDEAAAQKQLAKDAASKQKKGYVVAEELSDDAIKQLFAQDIIQLKLGKEAGQYDLDYVGGTPRGLAAKQWPKQDGKPLGHLLSISVRDGKKAGGISVFVPPNDLAMEEDAVVAMIRSSAQMGKAQGDAPSEVPVIVPHALIAQVVGGIEIDESRSKPFEDADPTFAARLESFHESLGTGESYWTKWSGSPKWVQGEDWPCEEDGTRWKFVAQVDFESLPHDFIQQAWPEVSVWGVLYAFINPQETEAVAFWQYT